MSNKPVFYDSDTLICFLAVNECRILKEMFSKIIVPAPVYHEIINLRKYPNLKEKLNKLIDDNFVEIKDFIFNSPENIKFNLIYKGYWTDGKPIGMGESAAMSFAIENNGIVASNNLNDVREICEKYDLPIITSSMILAFSFELSFNSKDEINRIWDKIHKTTEQKLPKVTFDEYYDELFKKDCNDLLKSYDFKKLINRF